MVVKDFYLYCSGLLVKSYFADLCLQKYEFSLKWQIFSRLFFVFPSILS